MKCPKCGKEGCKYQNRVSTSRGFGDKNEKKYLVSKDKVAKCTKCGWIGVC